jgi:N-acetylmuramic acid 6-phosphate etherase
LTDIPEFPPATETIDPRYRDLDSWGSASILAALWEAQMDAVAAVRTVLPALATAADDAVPLLQRGGRLIYAGAGTSGRIGVQDGAELPPTFNWPAERLVLLMAGGAASFTGAIENAEDDEAAASDAIAAHQVGPGDVVLGIAASGSTPYTTRAIRDARRRCALTIGIANSAGGALLAEAQHKLLVETGAEAIAGSTRLKAGTAQKVVLNLFSTLVMIRLGHVHQGLMVDMQARNAKLRLRAVRMLRALSGETSEPVLLAALEAGGGRVKPAVLVLRGLTAAQADALIERHGGSLREALSALDPQPGRP